jgi:hypothetical protein
LVRSFYWLCLAISLIGAILIFFITAPSSKLFKSTKSQKTLGAEKIANWLKRNGHQVKKAKSGTKSFGEYDTVYLSALYTWELPVLIEEAKKKNFLLPVPFLHMMIQFGNTALSEFFEKHLPQIINNYLSLKTSMASLILLLFFAHVGALGLFVTLGLEWTGLRSIQRAMILDAGTLLDGCP